MTKEHVIQVFEKYRSQLSKHYLLDSEGERIGPMPRDSYSRERHIIWMCKEGAEIARAGKTDKSMRWLGFIQGYFWLTGFYSLEEMKKDNMPSDEVFDAERV